MIKKINTNFEIFVPQMLDMSKDLSIYIYLCFLTVRKLNKFLGENKMKRYFWKFLMKRIQDVDEATDLGKRVYNKKLEHKFFKLQDGDYVFEIYQGEEKIFEFICTPIASRFFLDEVIDF